MDEKDKENPIIKTQAGEEQKNSFVIQFKSKKEIRY